jgi:ASC-1-like (ASCH) protein
MKHTLKILPCYFEAVIRGEKKFEIRDNSDRGFQKGDIVDLVEIKGSGVGARSLTGRSVIVEITYVTGYQQKTRVCRFRI